MNPNAAKEYLRAKVLTSTPEQLQMLLFDGAIRFCDQARLALEQKNYEVSYNTLSRAQKILLELNAGLKPDVAPELCANLRSLYLWCYKQLVDANVQRDKKPVEDVLAILRYQRETWALLLEKLGRRNAGTVAKNIDLPAPDSRMEASIRISA